MSSSDHNAETLKTTATPAANHMMSTEDSDNPHNWPLVKKVYVSVAASAFAFVV